MSGLAPFFKAMTELFAFILGFLACAALCWKRLRELKAARDATLEQNEMLWGQNEALIRSEQRHREMLQKLFAQAREFNKRLSGTVPPPTAAELTRRSIFSRRAQ